MTNLHRIREKQPARDELDRLMAAFLAEGGEVDCIGHTPVHQHMDFRKGNDAIASERFAPKPAWPRGAY